MTHSRKLFLMSFCVLNLMFLTHFTYAQTPAAAKVEASDPKAKALLDKVKKQYEGYNSLETNFTLTLKMAEQTKEEVQKGKMYQEKDKFRIEIGKQLVISDGKIVWQKVDNNVQIKNASAKSSSSTEVLSIKDMMSVYDKKFIWGIVGETTEGWSKKAMTLVGKPMDRRNEYSKVQITIDQKTNQVISMTAFGKDQSRYKLSMDAPVLNKQYAATFFTFDKSKYPNVKVVDLRED
jgi:outer membrane lipoprotein carrier protein